MQLQVGTLNERDLLKKVKEHVRNKTYFLAKHALERQIERQINLPEIIYVLEHGKREQTKDTFDVKRQLWKYAIRGKTSNAINLRVIVAFEEAMVIITVMKVK